MKAAFLLIAFLFLSGCAVTGPQAPPSTLDRALFTIQTNTQPFTNWVTQTNYQVVTLTNVDHQVVTTTNQVMQIVPQVTNQLSYVYAPNPNITGTVQAAGALGGPIGSAVAYGLTGLLGIFAFLKNKQANKLATVAGVSQQALATAQQVIGAIPNGQALLGQFNVWLATHQADADFAKELAQTVENFVDPTHAQIIAAGIVAQTTTPAAQVPATAK